MRMRSLYSTMQSLTYIQGLLHIYIYTKHTFWLTSKIIKIEKRNNMTLGQNIYAEDN